jgi:hypothetical protein
LRTSVIGHPQRRGTIRDVVIVERLAKLARPRGPTNGASISGRAFVNWADFLGRVTIVERLRVDTVVRFQRMAHHGPIPGDRAGRNV